MTGPELERLAAELGRFAAGLRAAGRNADYTVVSAAVGLVARAARKPPQRAQRELRPMARVAGRGRP